MTRYKRRSAQRAPARNETMRDLIAEVRALRAEIAMLADRQVQVVPMPYPQPYPVYPVTPVPAYPWNPPYWTTTIVGDTSNTFGSSLTSALTTTGLTYNLGD